MAIERKFVKVPHTGPIAAKGYMYGPILTPYHESVDLIGSMIMGNVSVVEVLNDGSELELDLNNFTIENNPVVAEAAPADTTPPASTPAASTPAPAASTPAPTAAAAKPAADPAPTTPAPAPTADAKPASTGTAPAASSTTTPPTK